jgi:acetyl-CoA acetyltransferase family protein
MKRIAVIDTCRTPFVRAGGVLAGAHFLDLAVSAVRGLLDRTKIDPVTIDELVCGTVLLDPRMPNWAREVVIRGGLPRTMSAHSVSNNCISGLVAVAQVADAIAVGRINSGLAVGTESMSRPALSLSEQAERFWIALGRAKSFGEILQIALKFRPGFARPIPPSPKEPSTGLTMGQHCELMAQEFHIPREAQDQFALRSHMNAARAEREGFLAEEIVAVGKVTRDNIVRGDTTLEKLAKLRPSFERSEKGTLTPGNSSALTDGAAAVLLMSEDEARTRGLSPLGYIEQIEFSAIDPMEGLLMAPVLAVPKMLSKAGLTLDSIDLFEIHEAFAAQVLCSLAAWEKGWSRHPELKPLGKIPAEKINVNGGSLALGHPFAATAGRLIGTALRELKRRNQQTAVLSICAAGAMGGAALLRRE